MPSTGPALQRIVEHIISTPSSFQIVEADTGWPLSTTLANPSDGTVNIAVLDSSFNPPTKAHEAIACSSNPSTHTDEEYSARLLLYTPKNADKTPSSSDASPIQRLEMMSLLASTIRCTTHQPTAVAIAHAPTFASKAVILRRYLVERMGEAHATKARLSFLVGMDTLVRIFDEKYYPTGTMGSQLAGIFEPPPKGSGASFISARRGTSLADRQFEEDLLARPDVKKWVEKGRVTVLGDGKEGWEEISSTIVRTAIKDGDRKTVERLVGEEVGNYVKKEGLYAGV